GYRLIKQKRMADALEVFKLNVYLNPASANAFDSLGEIYAEIGNSELAIKNYEQSLKLNPHNSNGQNQLKMLKAKR
ncbi:MAG: tetratricopeptide repeat protein, partial [Gelidibacter sp.]